MTISVVIPIYRSAAVLPELVARLTAMLQAQSPTFEIVAVNDACPDGSDTILRALAHEYPHLRIMTHPRNLGQQRAVLTGIRATTGQFVVVLDADLQDAPEDIPTLLTSLAQRRVDAVFAGRRGIYQSRSRMATSRLFKGLLASLLQVPRDAGSFVAMTRRTADAIKGYDGPHPYLLALVGATRLPIMSIPVPRSRRPVGHSSYTAFGRLRFAARALRTAWAIRNHTLTS